MGKPLSVDLRVRVVDAIGAGMSRRAAAIRFGISAAERFDLHLPVPACPHQLGQAERVV